MTGRQTSAGPDPLFDYHRLRSALAQFSRNLSQLDDHQAEQVRAQASRSYALENRVLASAEAQGLVIPAAQLDAALAQVAGRYASEDELLDDLAQNGLDIASLRHALHRELLFDAVMQRVAARCAEVSDIDVRLFYEMHGERFETPELRKARHILITINPDYADNTSAMALARMQAIQQRLQGRANRFADLARRFSECPTAMDGGKLGEVRRGTLYPELDAALFGLAEGALSDIIETELGLHVLLCEKIKPARRLPFAKAEAQIRQLLQERRRRNGQKAWLAQLQPSPLAS